LDFQVYLEQVGVFLLDVTGVQVVPDTHYCLVTISTVITRPKWLLSFGENSQGSDTQIKRNIKSTFLSNFLSRLDSLEGPDSDHGPPVDDH
uniref:Uncharacterized protein n=1 Tax=Cynoglossus semilaevis TaxID=244447 RepID=A0A3P8VCG0_CYNSE